MDHLPETERPWVWRKLRAAWANPNAAEAEAALKALAGQLDRVNPDAAASLREGLAETVTVTRLGVTGSLLKTVMSTNPVVIWSDDEGVLDVVEELLGCRDLCAGRGYLPPSDTQLPRRFDVCSAGGGARLAA